MSKFFEECELNILDGPVKSTEMNPTENIMSKTKRMYLRAKCATITKLPSAVNRALHHEFKWKKCFNTSTFYVAFVMFLYEYNFQIGKNLYYFTTVRINLERTV